MKTNKAWHLANRMPKNPTPEQRMHWHLEHSKHCNCREMPPKLKAILIEKKLITV
ncbi:MAG: hypothetical protein V4539_13895 [Bacteroidota bacterium]